jgi:hypothetical protein
MINEREHVTLQGRTDSNVSTPEAVCEILVRLGRRWLLYNCLTILHEFSPSVAPNGFAADPVGVFAREVLSESRHLVGIL